MLQRYQAVIPSGVTVSTARQVAEFFPIAGQLTTVEFAVNVANAGGPTTFQVKLNGASQGTFTIPSGQRSVVNATLAVAVVLGDKVSIHLTVWPTGGLVGPGEVQIGVDDGIVAGASVTDGTTTVPAPTSLVFGAGDVTNPSGSIARVKTMADALAALGANDSAGRYKLLSLLLSDLPLDRGELVRHYYFGILGRLPITSELNSDVAALDAACLAATFSTQALARIDALFIGAEFLGLGTTTTQFINAVYRAYFGRDPDASGLAFWTNELNVVGTTRAAMRAQFAGHQEFLNRMALYCRAQLPVANAVQITGQNPTVFVQGVIGTAITGVDLVVYTTAALADGATEYVSLPMGGKYWKVYRIAADRSCRVRAYGRDAQRTADAARPIGVDPTGEHGIIFDLYMPASNLDWDSDRKPDGCNMDDLTSSNAWVAITNMSGAVHTVQIIIHRRLL
jgi:hypothetical protein